MTIGAEPVVSVVEPGRPTRTDGSTAGLATLLAEREPPAQVRVGRSRPPGPSQVSGGPRSSDPPSARLGRSLLPGLPSLSCGHRLAPPPREWGLLPSGVGYCWAPVTGPVGGLAVDAARAVRAAGGCSLGRGQVGGESPEPHGSNRSLVWPFGRGRPNARKAELCWWWRAAGGGRRLVGEDRGAGVRAVLRTRLPSRSGALPQELTSCTPGRL
jgi:hypothetical protein